MDPGDEPENGHHDDVVVNESPSLQSPEAKPRRKASRKSQRPSKKKSGDTQEDTTDAFLAGLVQGMKKAVADDNRSNEENRPAVEKIKMLDTIYGVLINKKHQQGLMDNDVLTAIRMWLEPLPDRSLPNSKVRKGMLDALMHMKVDVDHLSESSVGKIVNFYSFNPQEDKDVRKLAKSLVQKWTKLVLADED